LGIIRLSIRRPVTVAMFFVAIAVFGFISFSQLSVDLLPDITYPTLTVRTEYPGAAPSEVENLVTGPVEEAVGVVNNVVRVSSVSRPGLSEVLIEFTWGTDMDFASLDVREKLDLVRLPDDAEKPVLLRFDPSLDPIMRIGLYGGRDFAALRLLAEKRIKQEIESLDGVAAVRVSGGLEEEVQLEISEGRLSVFGIPISQVATRLAQENVNTTGGTLREGDDRYIVRVLNEFKSPDEINDIIVAQRNGVPIRFSQIGRVVRGYKDRDVITKINGRESVEIAVYKESGTNTVTVAGVVKDRLKDIDRNLRLSDQGLKLEVVSDQSGFIRRSVDEVLKAAVWGGILAIAILYLFLRSLRSTTIIGMAIPVSVISTFFLMYLFGVSLNIMSLGGLALGIGMLVDNSIVVLESINRYQKGGKPLKEAVEVGAGEVGKAVIAATLTTICVFIPIIFVRGIAGQLFTDQALAVVFSLSASLLVALTLIPMLASLGFERGGSGDDPRPGRLVLIFAIPLRGVAWCLGMLGKLLNLLLAPLYLAFDASFGYVRDTYPRLLDWALSHRARVIAISFAAFVASILLARLLGGELIPELSQGEFTVHLRLPPGTPIDVTNRVVSTVESFLRSDGDINRVYSIIGSSGSETASLSEQMENVGQINVVLKKGLMREAEERVMDRLRGKLRDIPGLEYRFSRPTLFSLKSPIQVEVIGRNLDELRSVSEAVARRLSAIEGLTDVKSSMEGGSPEVQITFNRERLAALGTDIRTIASTIRDKVYGDVPTKLRKGDRDIDIRVRAEKDVRRSLNDLSMLTVGFRNGVPVPLSSVAELRVRQGPSEIRRIDQQRVALVTANLRGRDLASVSREIESSLSDIPLPVGISIKLGGQGEEMATSFASMNFAIFLAIFLVYLVMASQFESLFHPFVIMFTIPFGAVGAILALLVTGQRLSVVVFIGAIMLAGIVVNNAIVLVDYINQLRRRGMGKYEAIKRAAAVRLRPILMTTSTTVLGLLPLALGIGEGAEVRAPMAITVIGGLLISTLLTLVLIPTVYSILARGD